MRRTLTSVARKAGAVLPTGQRVAQRAVHKSTAQALSARGMARAMAGTRSFFSYSHALVRGLSPAFEDSLKLHAPETPIDMNLAHQQHDSYTQLLRLLVPNVIELPADARYPDCCFVEDTTVIVGDTAVITKIGADARQGEEVGRELLQRVISIFLKHSDAGSDEVGLGGSRISEACKSRGAWYPRWR